MSDIALMLDALSRDRPRSPRVAQFIEAAARGEQELEDSLDGVLADDESPVQGTGSALRGPLYLRRLTVSGFRGIGPGISVEFEPSPGLTVIFGPNGTGKSSLIEALELAMCGKLRRVEGRTVVWKQAIGNLHQRPVRIAVDFEALTGTSQPPAVQIRATSPRDPMKSLDIEFLARRPEVRPAWARATVIHRPLLTGEELQRAFAGRASDLHDSIFEILGLGTLLPVRDLLIAARRKRETALKAATRSG